ncbi:DUF2848 family protein [Paraburkholderia fynbosensis]|uniref:DUF2848 family protein n=1 Tax=Paraburkholderia fynbosensis TaxID=1200993 RepID=UPI001FE421FE|nr:DUF2848 family protein [Paraburkholderia fynbosensis]
MNVHKFTEQSDISRTIQLVAIDLTIAGWTGRNSEAVQHHIDELAAIGVAPPKQIPTLYRVARALAHD